MYAFRLAFLETALQKPEIVKLFGVFLRLSSPWSTDKETRDSFRKRRKNSSRYDHVPSVLSSSGAMCSAYSGRLACADARENAGGGVGAKRRSESERMETRGGIGTGAAVKRETRTCWSVCEGARESFESTSSYNQGKVVTGVSKARLLVPRIIPSREIVGSARKRNSEWAYSFSGSRRKLHST